MAFKSLYLFSHVSNFPLVFKYAMPQRQFGTFVNLKNFSYDDAVQRLNSLQTNASVLAGIRKANLSASSQSNDACSHTISEETLHCLRILGHTGEDLNQLNIIHVTGTKGKGSTVSFSERILRENGLSTGLYTSPHLIEVRERIRFNGSVMTKEDFAESFFHCWSKLMCEQTDHVTLGYFRFLTIFAFHVFLKRKVDVVLLEVGIGGLLDYTNVISRPWVCGISSIGYDHQSILGNSLKDIAKNKAGIMKHQVPCFTVEQEDEAMNELEIMAKKISAPLYIVRSLDDQIQLGLGGFHQRQNAALAVALTNAWLMRWRQPEKHSIFDNSPLKDLCYEQNPTMLPETTLKGLRLCKWPGRGHMLRLKYEETSLSFFLDGAHTAESMETCIRWFQSAKSQEPNVLIFNFTGDRSLEALLTPLVKWHLQSHHLGFEQIIWTSNQREDSEIIADQVIVDNMDTKHFDATLEGRQNWMTQTWQQIQHELMKENVSEADQKGKQPSFVKAANVDDALRLLKGRNVNILVTGSLHLVGSFLSALDPSCCEQL